MGKFVMDYKLKALEVLHPFGVPWFELVFPLYELESFKFWM